MDDEKRQAAFMSALTTEHFVLQTAANGTVSESLARASLYVVSLSSALVALGFAARSPTVFVPFVATVLPGLFLLGVFTVVRLVDAALEYMQCLIGIARIRGYYRTLTPEAAVYFATETGRWPEARSAPTLRLGVAVAFVTTNASMVAAINSILGGVGISLLSGHLLPRAGLPVALSLGVAGAVASMAAFLAYQRWRYEVQMVEGGVPAAATRTDPGR